MSIMGQAYFSELCEMCLKNQDIAEFNVISPILHPLGICSQPNLE
jgi:hypothetical protein